MSEYAYVLRDAIRNDDVDVFDKHMNAILEQDDNRWNGVCGSAFYSAVCKENIYFCEKLLEKYNSIGSGIYNSVNGYRDIVKQAVYIDNLEILKIVTQLDNFSRLIREKDLWLEIKSKKMFDFLNKRGFFPKVSDVLRAVDLGNKETFDAMMTIVWDINEISQIYYGCNKIKNDKDKKKDEMKLAEDCAEMALAAFKNGKYKNSVFNTDVRIW